jgi:hypothetical protein
VLATLRALLPAEYPSHAPPLVELGGYHLLPPTAADALGTFCLASPKPKTHHGVKFDVITCLRSAYLHGLPCRMQTVSLHAGTLVHSDEKGEL